MEKEKKKIPHLLLADVCRPIKLRMRAQNGRMHTYVDAVAYAIHYPPTPLSIHHPSTRPRPISHIWRQLPSHYRLNHAERRRLPSRHLARCGFTVHNPARRNGGSDRRLFSVRFIHYLVFFLTDQCVHVRLDGSHSYDSVGSTWIPLASMDFDDITSLRPCVKRKKVIYVISISFIRDFNVLFIFNFHVEHFAVV